MKFRREKSFKMYSLNRSVIIHPHARGGSIGGAIPGILPAGALPPVGALPPGALARLGAIF